MSIIKLRGIVEIGVPDKVFDKKNYIKLIEKIYVGFCTNVVRYKDLEIGQVDFEYPDLCERSDGTFYSENVIEVNDFRHSVGNECKKSEGYRVLRFFHNKFYAVYEDLPDKFSLLGRCRYKYKGCIIELRISVVDAAHGTGRPRVKYLQEVKSL